MTFFYDLNKKLADLAAKQDQQLNESVGSTSGFLEGSTGDYSAKKAAAGKDIGKPGKMFSKIAKDAGKRYGSKERGEKVAGAVLAKLRAKEAIDPSLEEADMDEGNEFSGALAKAKAAGAKEFEVDGKKYQVKEAAKPDFLDLDKDGNKKESMKKAAADKKKNAFDPEVARSMFASEKGKTKTGHDVKDTGYSKRYTKKLSDEPEADDSDDSTPKKKGRKTVGTGKGKKIGAKHSGTSKLHRKDAIAETDDDSIALVDKGEYDREGEMAKQQIHTIMRAAKRLHGMLSDDENLPEWVQKKITLAQNYLDGVSDYLASVDAERGEEMVPERKLSSSEKEEREDIVKGMKKNKSEFKKRYGKSGEEVMYATATKLAKERGPGNPDRKKKEESVAETDAPKSSKGGFQFGQGVYESMDKQFKQMLNEGMNVSINMGTDADGKPSKNITVSADGDDAEALASLLKMAGMGEQNKQVCPSCGSADCGCEELDENSPDWPTNTEKSNNALQYSGGLNGPKSTGQTTVPVIASQLRRQVSMEESVELERSLFKLYNEYKSK